MISTSAGQDIEKVQEQGPDHWFIHSFNKYLLSFCYVPGPGLGVLECSCEQDIELRVQQGK